MANSTTISNNRVDTLKQKLIKFVYCYIENLQLLNTKCVYTIAI